MSYRAFKRLLGETSLERKCRFLFGAFILVLITLSFALYARQTERLAYEQLGTTGRLLVVPEFARLHPSVANDDGAWKNSLADLKQKQWEQPSAEGMRPNESRLLFADADSKTDREIFERFSDEPTLSDLSKEQDKSYRYYSPLRASTACLNCHHESKGSSLMVKEGDLLGVLEVSVPTAAIQKNVDWNRALLITTAIITALLVMSGSYIIVRYVIVKPVKHLKEVSDAIAAGELNVRSEIQTGDEFEDLSHAFNRMLRNLVSMQDRLRHVNADLDHKVDELARANMSLYESNRLKGDFLATVSHELRTPLNSILGFSEVLLSGDQLTEKQQRWMKNIQSSGEKLLNLINDILDLAKIEAGKMQVRISEFSVYDVCEASLTMFRPLAEKKNIDLRGQFEAGIPVVRQDSGKLQQILANLLSNAIKFTPEGGRVLLHVDTKEPQVIFTVNDTGVGIAQDEQAQIFEKFRQGANPLTREHPGTGLGLSIVKELSKLLGGEVSLQSELGRGSTFTVTLPTHLSTEPKLEFDIAHEGVDLSKAQRIDARLYVGTVHDLGK